MVVCGKKGTAEKSFFFWVMWLDLFSLVGLLKQRPFFGNVLKNGWWISGF